MLSENIATSPTDAIMLTVDAPTSATLAAIQPTGPLVWGERGVVEDDMRNSRTETGISQADPSDEIGQNT